MKFIIDNGRDRFEFPLREGTTIVGRDPSCDIVLDHPRVSRRHLTCVVKGGEVTIRDMDSRNGTFVSDVQVEECKLMNGDSVRVGGEVQLIFDQGAVSDGATIITGSAPGAGPASAPSPTAAPPLKNVPSRPAADAPPSPGGDDDEPTPQDENMLPAQYVGPEGANPRVITRDGRWYAQDPATGREVEIQPVGYPHTAPAPSFMQKIAGLGLATKVALLVCPLVIVGVILAAVMQPKKDNGKGRKRVMKREQYYQMIEDAVAKLEANNVAGARKLLEHAHKARPELKAAERLSDVCDLWLDLKGQDFRAVQEEAEKRLNEIIDADHMPQKARTFATKQVDWIYWEMRNGSVLSDCKELEKSQDWDKAARLYGTVPKDSLFYKEAQERSQKIKQTVTRSALEQGQRAMDDEKWDDAADAFKRVLMYEPDYPELKEKIRACRRSASDQKKLEDALAAKGEGDWQQVALLVEDIKPDGPYGARAGDLKKLVAAKGLLIQAQGLYDGGDAEAALAKLRDAKSTDAQQLAARIRYALSALQKGNQAAERKNYREAVGHWQDVVRAEENDKNPYRREAQDKIDSWKEEAVRLAQSLVRQASDAYGKGDYAKARSLLDDAQKMDPNGEAGAGLLKEMLDDANRKYIRAYAVRKDQPDAARKLLLKVKSMLRPGDDLYRRVILELGNLGEKED